MPKAPNTVWSVLLVALPAITLFLTDLNQSGLIAAGSLDVVLLLLATYQKYREEQAKLVATRSLDAKPTVSVWRNVLIG